MELINLIFLKCLSLPVLSLSEILEDHLFRVSWRACLIRSSLSNKLLGNGKISVSKHAKAVTLTNSVHTKKAGLWYGRLDSWRLNTSILDSWTLNTRTLHDCLLYACMPELWTLESWTFGCIDSERLDFWLFGILYVFGTSSAFYTFPILSKVTISCQVKFLCFLYKLN